MKSKTWQLQTAKNKFSEVVNEAIKGNPQLVTKQGKPAVYVVDCKTFEDAVQGKEKEKKRILLSRPHKEIELVIERDRDEGRSVDL